MKPIQSDSRETWRTPQWLLDDLIAEFGPLFDPCPPDPLEDGLEIDWPRDRAAFVNPPYRRGALAEWARACRLQNVSTGSTVILLIPPYTDTVYFHTWILPHAQIRFLRGRLKFDDAGAPAPFPSILCVFPGRQGK
jgi:hypothetical protein